MFNLRARGSTIGTEVLAGATTFLTVAYILFLNPKMLGDAGMPANDVATMIALGGAICAILIGLITNLPFVLAPGVGMSAFFAYGAVLGYGVDWRVALAAALIAGLIFFLLVLVGLRNFLYMALPQVVRTATTVDSPATLITLGKISDPMVHLSLFGLLLAGALMAWQVRSAILISIITVTVLAWLIGLSPMPQQWFALPTLTGQTILAVDFNQFFSVLFFKLVIAFFFLAVLDLMGTLSGINRLAGLMDSDGRVFGSHTTYAVDSVGIMLTSLLGTSPNTVFIESAVGMQVGGRTGLTALTVGFLFLIALFFIPVFTAIPAIATAPALIVVGAMMMRGASDLDWTSPEDIIPAFLTIASMAFTFNIAHGIAFGIISYTLLYASRGRFDQLNWAMILLTAILMVYLAFYL